ncbi:MAG TPA: 6-carboxytetrahydropterin synthase [Thermoanaerobaculia bacterium]|nr:6-carboxytetrahydropterin synthase [Thermoanaerobaculia bacterium]
MLLLTRTIHFNAAHRLHRPDRSEEWNRATYGEAANEAGYGHNYALEVGVEGRPDAETAMIVNLADLDRVLKEEIDRPLDHRNLNREVEAFQNVVPTAENLGGWIWRRIEARLERDRWPCRLAFVRLTVTPTFSVELLSPAAASLQDET